MRGIGYGPYVAPVSRWQHKGNGGNGVGSLWVAGKTLLAYRCMGPTPVEFLSSLTPCKERLENRSR